MHKLEGDVIDLEALKTASIVPVFAEQAHRAVGRAQEGRDAQGHRTDQGRAEAAIEAAGGKIEAAAEAEPTKKRLKAPSMATPS